MCLALSRSGRFVYGATSARNMYCFDLLKDETMHTMRGDGRAGESAGGGADAAAMLSCFAPLGTVMDVHARTLNAIECSWGGNVLATCAEDHVMKFWIPGK